MRHKYKLASRSRILRLAELGRDLSSWYDSALAQCETVCRAEQWGVSTFVARVACLSPVVAVRRNIRNAILYSATGDFLENTIAVSRGLVARFESTGIVGGIKVAEFYRAIMGNRDACVFDTWMGSAFYCPQYSFRSQYVRADCRATVATVARTMGLCVRDCQATIWGGIIRDSGRVAGDFPIVSEYDNFLRHGRDFPRFGTIDTGDDSLPKLGFGDATETADDTPF